MIRKILLALAGTLAWGQTSYYQCDEPFKIPALLWDDTKALAASPGAWTATDWAKVGFGAAAVLGAALVLDKPLDDAVLRSTSPARDRLARNLAQVGGTGGLVLMGAGYSTFSLLDQKGPRSVVVDMGLATILAQAASLPLKVGVGRARPADGLGEAHFSPLTSRASFPSGHAAQAFAMASALSMRTSAPWVGWVAYGTAALVGVARLETRDHFTSDVLAGALVGTAIGRSVVVLDQGLRARTQFTVTPVFGAGFKGVTLKARF